ncbi:hypothetical protein GYMLUDRAFT_249694 [Collybiopsis luxurians FD-317 M1]|uniref:Uncharacterized protein n=1 Tax=Collybiopsis luxurians FD-317 M1 TaxID=944289 RepID=A0A0D0BHH9_9AGAR|nr:hypothetical protein GYMLUDRAFT_249694 [Collybiopsis luxurians FD-317 M1]
MVSLWARKVCSPTSFLLEACLTNIFLGYATPITIQYHHVFAIDKGQCANFERPTPDDIAVAFTSLTLRSLGPTRLLSRVLSQKVCWIDLSSPQRRAHLAFSSSLSLPDNFLSRSSAN